MRGQSFRAFALATVAVAAAAGPAAALDDVKLRLNWMYYGSHAGFALGKVEGIYRDAGIQIDIRSGNGSGSAHRLVANGDSDFSYGSCAAMMRLRAEGAPLVSVAVIDALGTEAVIVRPDAGIDSIDDLKGQTVLTTANAGVNTFWPLVQRNAGLAEGDVALVNVAEGALVSAYLQGAGGAVAILGGLDDKPAEIRAAGGADPVTFPYSDYGVNQVGYCIVAREDRLRDNPDLVRRFVGATVKAYQETAADPERAVRAMGDIVGGTMNEEAGQAQALEVLKVTLGVLTSGRNSEGRVGMHVPADWEDMLTLMKDFNGLVTDLPATAFYSNDFLP